MHESAIAQAVVRTVVGEAKKRRARRVTAVELEVGALEGLGGRELRFAFELEAAGTPLEGAKLRVTKSAPSASCPACGKPRNAPLPRGHFHALPPKTDRQLLGGLSRDPSLQMYHSRFGLARDDRAERNQG